MEKITDRKAKELAPGVRGHYVHGQQMTFGHVTLEPGSVVPAHSHPNEQITYILEGQLHMTIGGIDCLLEPGMYYVIHAGVVHSARALTLCKLVDVFNPVRTDYV